MEQAIGHKRRGRERSGFFGFLNEFMRQKNKSKVGKFGVLTKTSGVLL